MSDDALLQDMRAQIRRGELDAAASMARASAAAALRSGGGGGGEDVEAPRHALAPLHAPAPSPAPSAPTPSPSPSAPAVVAVEIPADAAPESRAQLERLTDALLRGAVPQREYDELVPFLLQRDEPQVEPQAEPQGAEDAQPSPYALLQGSAPAGVTLRCASCGSPNDTARGLRCGVCGEALTLEAEPASSAASAPVVQAQPPRDAQGRTHRDVFYTLSSPSGSFSLADDGSERVVIHDGFLFCDMHGTQLLPERPGAKSTFAVFVVLCQWTPRAGSPGAAATTWFVSQRFSSFETLDDSLRRRLRRTGSSRRRSSSGSSGNSGGSDGTDMPAFPAKYYWTNQLQKRRHALATYLKLLLRFCASQLGREGTLAPELDQFLTVSRQVEQFRRQSLPPSVASALGSAAAPVAGLQPPQQQQATPMDAQELVQAESAVQLLQATLEAGGDLRRDQHVQHHLTHCLALLPALRATADVDSPFVEVDLVPRALQCQEDIERAVATYNDALLARLSMAVTAPAVESGAASMESQQPLAAR